MIVAMSDEMIMALADGELDPRVAAQVRVAIRDDDEIRRRYDLFLGTRRLMANTYGSVLDEPLPERLVRPLTGN